MARKYLQYHFDGEGKQKSMKNEDKEEKEGDKRKEEEGKSIHLGWSSAEFAGIRETSFSGRLAKYLQPMVPQLNIEGTTASKISVVERLAHKTKALVILLQETHCTCVDKLVIPNFALTGSIPRRKHGLATFVRESLSWTLASQSLIDSEIEWLCVTLLA